ncbi:MAG: CDF family Co(II)/Ni(II) efflux transporter DmeF [Thermodesulfobacteriota bacterium]|nr:CDF family Co(II)/Ni(II) efflux transporter DmeF [Thermodesulfobacteriota bacterium]
MHIYNLDNWIHDHRFDATDTRAEKRTWAVIILTFVTMIAEIIAGMAFGSMALLADGWHMGTHVAALGITVFAYWYARKHRNNVRFTFGTGKVGVLGGFASAVVLAVVSILMAGESVHRLLSPVDIRFNQAIAVAVLGLIVNLVSALILGRHDHDHGHSHDHNHDHNHGEDDHADDHHRDHNLKAAYLHVLADALTSITAIIALVAGKIFGWHWLDPFVGIAGAIVIAVWAYGLVRATSRILLDSDVSPDLLEDIQKTIEADADNKVVDLHAWKIDAQNLAVMISLVTHYPRDNDHYRSLLSHIPQIKHLTVEVIQGPGDPCIPLNGQCNNNTPDT